MLIKYYWCGGGGIKRVGLQASAGHVRGMASCGVRDIRVPAKRFGAMLCHWTLAPALSLRSSLCIIMLRLFLLALILA